MSERLAVVAFLFFCGLMVIGTVLSVYDKTLSPMQKLEQRVKALEDAR